MDIHTHHRPLDAYENVIEHLRGKHIRITETRKAIIAYLINSTEHPSADKIYKDLLPEHPSLSLATVYNNIKVLFTHHQLLLLTFTKHQVTGTTTVKTCSQQWIWVMANHLCFVQ